MLETAWYKVLYYWCYQKTPLGSGLTIPFLIGVEREFGRGENFNVSDLIDEFISISAEFSLVIGNCDEIGTEVCSLEILNTQEKEYLKSFGSLYLTSSDYRDIEELDELKDEFKKDYQIIDKEYSITNGQWSDFSIDDMEIIENGLNT